MAANLEKLADQLSELSVLEAADLVKMLEEKWGVSAAAPVAMAAAGPAAAAEPEEEKTEFDVVIKDAGPKKIEVIKVIRQLTSLGLGVFQAAAVFKVVGDTRSAHGVVPELLPVGEASFLGPAFDHFEGIVSI